LASSVAPDFQRGAGRPIARRARGGANSRAVHRLNQRARAKQPLMRAKNSPRSAQARD
jgi:hypothetical protein